MPLTHVRPRAAAVAPPSLAELSEPSTVTSLEGLSTRLAELNERFNRTNDRRGVFTAVYAPCVRRLVKEIRAGSVKDPATAERVVLALEFGPVHAHEDDEHASRGQQREHDEQHERKGEREQPQLLRDRALNVRLREREA